MNNPLQQQHARPLSTATMQHPGAIRNVHQLMQHIAHPQHGGHIPVWLKPQIAAQVLAQHAPSGMAIAHPGVPMPMQPPQMPQQPPQGQPQGYAMGGVINPPPQIGPVNDNTQGGVSGGLAERKGPPQRQPFSRPGLGGLAVGRGGAGLGGVPVITPPTRNGQNFLGPPVPAIPPEPGDSSGQQTFPGRFPPPPLIGPINDGGLGGGAVPIGLDPNQPPQPFVQPPVGQTDGIPTDSGGGNPTVDPTQTPPGPGPTAYVPGSRQALSAGQDPNIDPSLLAPGSQAWLMQQKFGGGPLVGPVGDGPFTGQANKPAVGSAWSPGGYSKGGVIPKGGMVKKKNDHDADDKPRKKTKKK